jgi:uncharacterized protein (TIGR03086 family)
VGTAFEAIVDRYLCASAGFERILRLVRPEQWSWPTPCTEWDVRALTNHMTRGNLNFLALANGGTAADFLRMRAVDALGDDPVAAYTGSVRECAAAFTAPGVLERVLDYPLGRSSGGQLLAVRTTDSVVHTWDLARGVHADEALDADLVSWISEHVAAIYAGLAESPVSPETTHRFFAPPPASAVGASERDRLLSLMGRDPDRAL